MEKRLVITEQNKFLEFNPRRYQDPALGPAWFDVSISGIVDSAVTLQRRWLITDEWRDVETYTEDAEAVGMAPTGGMYRIGVKTGEYGSDTVSIVVRQ